MRAAVSVGQFLPCASSCGLWIIVVVVHNLRGERAGGRSASPPFGTRVLHFGRTLITHRYRYTYFIPLFAPASSVCWQVLSAEGIAICRSHNAAILQSPFNHHHPHSSSSSSSQPSFAPPRTPRPLRATICQLAFSHAHGDAIWNQSTLARRLGVSTKSWAPCVPTRC